MKPRKSITWRIAGYLLGFIIVLLAALWLSHTVLLPTLYREHRKTTVASIVSEIGGSLGAPLFSRTVTQTAREQSACIRVLRLSGTEILSMDFMPYSALGSYTKEELLALWQEAALSGGSLTEIYAMDSLRLKRLVPSGVDAILYVQIFQVEGKEPTAVFYNSTITSVDGMQQVLKTVLYFTTAAAMIFGILLAFWVARITTRPITRINQQARRLKAQDYPVVFDIDNYLEVAELSDTLNETSREMEQLEGLRRELIANVSHDLRTPLAMIIAYGEIMRDVPGENTPENVQVIIDETHRLSELVNDVLLYPERSGTLTELNCTSYDFAAACRSTIHRYQKMGGSRNYNITYEGPDSALILGDRIKLSQVVYNLLNNAISHAGGSPEIQLRVLLLDNDCMRVEVVDHGEGIPPEKQELIWTRYYSDTGDNESFHAGLGLTIVRGILELHRAQYGVDSTLGEGSTFWFSMKRFDPERGSSKKKS